MIQPRCAQMLLPLTPIEEDFWQLSWTVPDSHACAKIDTSLPTLVSVCTAVSLLRHHCSDCDGKWRNADADEAPTLQLRANSQTLEARLDASSPGLGTIVPPARPSSR